MKLEPGNLTRLLISDSSLTSIGEIGKQWGTDGFHSPFSQVITEGPSKRKPCRQSTNRFEPGDRPKPLTTSPCICESSFSGVRSGQSGEAEKNKESSAFKASKQF